MSATPAAPNAELDKAPKPMVARELSSAVAGGNPGRSGKARRWLMHTALFLAGIALILLAVLRVNAAKVGESLGRLDATTIVAALLLYSIGWAARTKRLQVLSHAVGVKLSLGQAASTSFGANALNLVAPARLGDVAAFMRLRRSSNGSIGAASLITWRLADLGALFVVAFIAGLPILLVMPPRSANNAVVWAAAGGAGFLVLAAALIWASRHHKFRSLLDAVARRLLGSRAPTGAAFGRALAAMWAPRVFTACLALAVGAWVCDVAVAGLILKAIWAGSNPFIVVLVPVLLANAAKLVPTTPGALGVFEGVMWVSLKQFGVPDGEALAAAVATHLFMNVYTLVFGVPGAIAAGRAMAGAKDQDPT